MPDSVTPTQPVDDDSVDQPEGESADVPVTESDLSGSATPVPDVEPDTDDYPTVGDDGDDGALSPDELEYLRANEVAFRWQASEYVHHEKSVYWFGAVGLVLVVMVTLAIISHYWLEIGVFVMAAIAVVLYAKKPPRVLTYEVSPQGVSVDGRLHPYSEFRSFGVVPDIEWHTIDLDPVKRLSPRLSILFDGDDFDEIISHLELHLPQVDRDPDPIERFSRYIRF